MNGRKSLCQHLITPPPARGTTWVPFKMTEPARRTRSAIWSMSSQVSFEQSMSSFMGAVVSRSLGYFVTPALRVLVYGTPQLSCRARLVKVTWWLHRHHAFRPFLRVLPLPPGLHGFALWFTVMLFLSASTRQAPSWRPRTTGSRTSFPVYELCIPATSGFAGELSPWAVPVEIPGPGDPPRRPVRQPPSEIRQKYAP